MTRFSSKQANTSECHNHLSGEPFVRARSLKIEMVLPTMYAAGMEVLVARLTRALVQHGHDVGITCIESGGPLADELLAEGHRVSLVPAPGARSNLYASGLRAWFSKLQPDVVHVHSGAWLKAARAARSAAIPCVVHTAHGVFEEHPWYLPALCRAAARYTDWIVAVSEPLRAQLVQEMRLDPQKIQVIPNGVDTDRFTPGPATGELRRRLAIPNGRPIVGNVARMAPVKNHALLLEAFALTRAQVPEAKLVIIGDGPLREAIEARIAALRLGSCVDILGKVDDVAAFYRDLDLFVLSSTGEGTSMSILEAMASGVCVVATAVGGNPYLLCDGRCGVLVPSGDSGRLAEAITTALQDSTRRSELASAARAHVAAQFSESAMVRAYEELYRSGVPTHGGSHLSVAGA